MASMQFFMPPKSRDPSTRVNNKSIDLFPPIYSLPTWDLCTSIAKQYQVKIMSQLVDMNHISSYGRPLWYVTWINIPLVFRGEINRIIKLIEFVKNKLQCGVKYSQSTNENSYDRLFLLAVIGCRVAIHLTPTSREAVDLVADFMAINLFVTKDRSRIFTTYGSEPILAEAAARLWNEDGKCYTDGEKNNIFLDAIPKIGDFITERTINQGHQGELAARLILLRAMDASVNKCKKNPINGLNFTGYVTVGQFLKVFIGEENFKEFCQKNKQKNNLELFLSGGICFNHFIQFTKKEVGRNIDTLEMSRKEVHLEFTKRLGAMACEPGHEGTDIEIPVYLPSNANQSSDEISLRFLLFFLIKITC